MRYDKSDMQNSKYRYENIPNLKKHVTKIRLKKILVLNLIYDLRTFIYKLKQTATTSFTFFLFFSFPHIFRIFQISVLFSYSKKAKEQL